MTEEQQLAEQAMRCAATGSAGHWPTVAGYLHDEVLRLREQAHSMVVDLNRAVYGCDTWPDRPLDWVWEHLLGQVRKAFGQEEVT